MNMDMMCTVMDLAKEECLDCPGRPRVSMVEFGRVAALRGAARCGAVPCTIELVCGISPSFRPGEYRSGVCGMATHRAGLCVLVVFAVRVLVIRVWCHYALMDIETGDGAPGSQRHGGVRCWRALARRHRALVHAMTFCRDPAP